MLALMIASAACSASETALLSLTHADRIRIRKNSPRLHAMLSALLSNPRAMLISVLLANTTVNVLIFSLGAVFSKAFEGNVAKVVSSSVIVLVVILVSELLPKSIASVHAPALAKILTLPLLTWHRFISPFRNFIEHGLVEPIVRVLRPRQRADSDPASSPSGAGLTADDLEALVNSGASQGVLNQSEERLLADVVQLSGVRVRQIMTPRVDIRWIDASATTQELLALAQSSGFAHFPVCRGKLDESFCVGMINVRSTLPALAKAGISARLPLTGFLQEAKYVPDRARVDQLLDELRTADRDLALCVNEHGDLTGMVTLDQVLAELVSVQVSATQLPEGQVRLIGLNTWSIPGRLAARDFLDMFAIDDPRATRFKVSTVAGLVYALLARVPKTGDVVRLGHTNLRVSAMNGRTVSTIDVEPFQEAPTSATKEGNS